MEAEVVKRCQEALLEMLGSIDEGTDDTVSGMRDEVSMFPDPTDRAMRESNRNLTLRIRDRERRLISKIRAALARIEAGTYGLCKICGEEISPKRLYARPVAELCIDCKEKQEVHE